jgi:hypothetical protein
LIAQITNAGVVTGVNIGTADFMFRDAVSGCTASLSAPVTVYDKPAINISGPTTICAGDTTYLIPAVGGYWQSTQPEIATITNDGLVIGVENGEARFVYTEGSSGCISDTSLGIYILGRPTSIHRRTSNSLRW